MIHAGVTPGLQRRRRELKPALEPVQEHPMAPTVRATVRYRPHKYGTEAAREGPRQCVCVRPLSVLAKLRDRYVKTLNKMALGADFTAVAGVHLADLSAFSHSRRPSLPSSQVHPSELGPPPSPLID